MRRIFLSLIAITALVLSLEAGKVAAKSKVHCKTVTVKKHGKKTTKRVCTKAKPKATPTPYPTLAPPTYFLDNPGDIAIDPNGTMYVTDGGNLRVDTISPDGKLLNSWHKSSGSDQFKLLYGIALDGAGDLYVADAQAHEVDKLTIDGKLLQRWDTQPAGFPASFPTLLAIDPHGTVYVSDFYRSSVRELLPDGTLTGDIGKGVLSKPYGITFDTADNLYVADYGANNVFEFAPDGSLLFTWGDGGNGKVLLRTPEAIRVDATGTIYVTEGGDKNDLVKFDHTGKELARWGGLVQTSFYDPAGMSFDQHGNIWLVEYAASQIQELSPDGTILKTIH